MVGRLPEKFVGDGTIGHLTHVRVITEHEGQIEGVEFRNQRAHRADADTRDGERADLRLLDHLLLAAELHRRVHLDADAAAARRFEFFAHSHDRLDGRIAQWVHVGCLEHELLLGKGGNTGRERAKRAGNAEAKHDAAAHDFSPPAGFGGCSRGPPPVVPTARPRLPLSYPMMTPRAGGATAWTEP